MIDFESKFNALMESNTIPHYTFVYGTLKDGFYNHSTYVTLGLAANSVQFIGKGSTVEKFAMCIAGDRNVPFLLPGSNVDGHCIQGEVYQLHTKSCIRGFDLIEGIGTTGLYTRELQLVRLANGDLLYCWIYTKAESMPYEKESLLAEYTLEHHLEYVPGSGNIKEEIKGLIRKGS